jgi:hypothetical protein
MSESLKRVRDGWTALRKSAVSFDGDVASTEHPDAVIARANAFLHRLADTERRVNEFRAHTEAARREPLHAHALATEVAESLEDRGWLTPLDEDLAAVFGRQTLPRIRHYNEAVNLCLREVDALCQELHVAAGQLSMRNVRAPKADG